MHHRPRLTKKQWGGVTWLLGFTRFLPWKSQQALGEEFWTSLFTVLDIWKCRLYDSRLLLSCGCAHLVQARSPRVTSKRRPRRNSSDRFGATHRFGDRVAFEFAV